MSTLKLLLLVVALLTSASVNAGLFGFGGDSWKEEVLLHDGQKVIVKRSLIYGGRHEIGQSEPIKEQTISFLLPGSNKVVTWVSEYGEDLGRTNFDLVAVHILNGIPYVVADPNLCLSYNKWGRPNPPYVFFKYDGRAWNRIPVSEFPIEFKTFNVVIGLANQTVEALVKQGLVSAETVSKRNSELIRIQDHPTIIREVMPNAGKSCPEMAYDGRGGWVGIDWFKDQPSYEACLQYCNQRITGAKNCLCDSFFKGK